MVINRRGCDGVLVEKPEQMIWAQLSDIEDVIAQLKSRGYEEFFLTGLSFGGNLVALYLAHLRKIHQDGQILAACSIANPFCMNESSNLVDSSYLFSRNLLPHYKNIYKENLIQPAVQKLVEKKLGLGKGVELLKFIETSRTIREHDSGIMLQFRERKMDSEEFYDGISSKNFIKEIGVPYLCLNNEKDPISPAYKAPMDQFISNPSTIFMELSEGGHIKFPQWGLEQSFGTKLCLDFYEFFCGEGDKKE